METQTENQRPGNGQLIYVPHKDTIRLLEVYVKRSLSLNDGTLGNKRGGKKEKWVTMPRKQRRHSSDPSLHLCEGITDEGIGTFSAVETPADRPETPHEESEKPTKKPKKNKKPSFWKSLFGIFSRRNSEDEEEDSPSEVPEVSKAEETSDAASTCLPTAPVAAQKKKSMRRKSIRRRFSKRKLSTIKLKPGKDLNPADITRVEGKYEGRT